MTSIAQITQNKKLRARTSFIESAWAGEAADRLAELAAEAGMEPGDADEILVRITEARADMKAAEGVATLRRAAAKAKAHAEATRTRASAEISKIEAESDAASFAAEDAQRALNAADSALQRVLTVYDEGLLPKSLLPKDVLGLMDRRELERKALEAESVKCAAFNDRNRVRDELQRLERDLRMLPISRDRKEQEARLSAEIERAKAALGAAETRLSDAERAHAKARSAL